MYLTYSRLNLKAQGESHNKCNKLVISFIGILLLLIVFFAYIFISTVDHSGLSDKEKLTLSIIHSISAFGGIFTAIVLCVYIRFHMSKRMQSEDDDDEEKGEKKSEKNVSGCFVRKKKITLKSLGLI